MIPALTAESRAKLLERRHESLRAHSECLRRAEDARRHPYDEVDDDRTARRHLENAARAEVEYLEALPRICHAPCPFCGKPLIRSFDAYGVDGPWWRSDAAPEEPRACPHFCCLTGSLVPGGEGFRPGDFDVHAGPEAPYVLPALLDQPGMTAVLSRIEMEDGAPAHVTTYFAEQRPPSERLTANWPRTIHLYKTQFSVFGWRRPDSSPDFDLLPWLLNGKLMWCAPEGDRTSFATEEPDVCPYLDLPGRREPAVLRARPRAPTGD